MASTTKYPNF